MVEYRIMVKLKGRKKYQCYRHLTESENVEQNAVQMVNWPRAQKVKVIATDSNGVTNDIIYK